MNWQELKRSGTANLKEHHIDNAIYDAAELLYSVSGLTPTTYPLHMYEDVPERTAQRYRSMISRRASHEPLQYITGTAWFYGEAFRVEPGVLIPRYDTETLIEALLPDLRENALLLDLCCGSGCILTTLLLNGPESVRGTASDISDAALRVTRKNLAKFGLASRTEVVKSDLFSALSGTYDIIASNPPYIPETEISKLQSEVRDFEPETALNGGRDGLVFYRRITETAPDFLRSGGTLAVEIGYDQGTDVAGIFRQNGFQDVSVRQDLSGRDRVVLGKKPHD